jgi:hypothetical protein
MNFIKKHFKDLIYISLFIVIILQTCGKFQPKGDIIKRDSVITYITHDSTIREKPIVTNTVVPTKQTIIEKYYYDTTSKDLKEKYLELAKKFETLKTFDQTIPIDTIGYVNIKDTVSQNDIKGRSVNYNIKEKQVFIKETIIKQAEPKRQLYYGGELGASNLGLNSAAVGLIYKDRRDNAYKISGGINFNLQPQITVGYYKPIKLKK